MPATPLARRLRFPKYQPFPKVIRIDPQSVTDIFEGKYLLVTLVVKPFLRIQKPFLLPVVRCTDKLLEAADGIFQHREHKLFFRLKAKLFCIIFEVLSGSSSVRLK